MWAEWSRAYGVIAAIRQGAAAKIRDFETLSSLIDEKVRYGGGYRALGGLHHKCPRIPLGTGWVSRRKTLDYFRKASPANPQRKVNRGFYAESSYEFES